LENCRGAYAREKRLESITQGLAEEDPQLRAECALNAGLDHVDAPQEQRDGAREIRGDQNSVHRDRSFNRGVEGTGWMARAAPALSKMRGNPRRIS
jgi:hypothetical protein